jgi:hypothetical protein
LNLSAIIDLEPCKVENSDLYCIGENITNDVLKRIGAKVSLSESEMETMYIKNTSVTEIEANTFVNITLNFGLYITYNSRLTSIDPKAFILKEGFDHFYNLIIANNSKLVGPNLFELSNNLKTRSELVLSGNAIREIPEDALRRHNGSNPLRSILLDNNQIERIGDSAFSALDQVAEINISHNRIDTIGENAFEIYIDFMKYGAINVALDLSYNKITSESFKSRSFALNYPLRFVPLDFTYNNITTLPQSVWSILTHKNLNYQIKLMGNDIICDCKAKWLSPDTTKGYFIVPDGVFCANTKKRFTDMTEKDFGCY